MLTFNPLQAFRAILVHGARLLTRALISTSKATNALIKTTVSWTAKSAVSTRQNGSGSSPQSNQILIWFIIDVPFSGGAFVGGMFLVIGVMVLGAVGYFLWIRLRGRRASYSVVNN